MFLGGDIWTMDPAQPRASALAVRAGEIVAVGSDAAIRPLIGTDTRVVELRGASVTPGLVDGHAHLYGLGAALESVDVRGAASAEAAATTVATAAAEIDPTGWIVGRGWDQNLWPNQAFPTHQELDAALGDRPVVLTRIDGHALWANSAAMRAAGVDRSTAVPAGGKMILDEAGEPTGVFIDAAMALIEAHVPPPSRQVRERRIRSAAKVAVAAGLTGVHEMGIDDATAAVYAHLAAHDALPLRVYAFLAGDGQSAAELRRRKPRADSGESFFALRGVKLYADGALGSRGALLLEPYSDDPGNHGLAVTAPKALVEVVEAAAASGWQVATHAIGDAANRAVLDAYEAAARGAPEADRRFRIEHAQVLQPDDVPRVAALGVLAAMQPTHATSDMPWAEQRLGPQRILGAYAWRTLLDAGVRVVAGSDFPVEEVSPLLGIYAAVTRQDASGAPAGGWYPAQRMSLEEALAAYTVAPAYAAFVEDRRGRLAPGYVADITVYDRPLAADRTLLSTAIAMTIVGGRVVFENTP